MKILKLSIALMLLNSGYSSADSVINACYSQKDGTLRITTGTSTCASKEVPISWNQQAGNSSAGKHCPSGQVVTGFSLNGDLICNLAGTGSVITPVSESNADTDGDGIPDSIDSCPSIPNSIINGIGFCPASIEEIRSGAVASGTNVVVDNVLVDSISTTGIIIHDPSTSSALNTLNVISSTLLSIPAELGAGDIISVHGTVTPDGNLSGFLIEIRSNL